MDWYNLQKEDLGLEFFQEIKIVLLRINDNPIQFPIETLAIRKAIIKRFPFTIFFYISGNVINVFAIFHSSRNPISWKKRFFPNNL